MRPADFISYQANGNYKPGKVIMQDGGWKNGYKQPDIPVVVGHNVLNNDVYSKQLLDAIRWGIDEFYRRMDEMHGVSVMTKYYQVMIDAEGGPLYTDQYSDRIIIPVYETIISNVVKNSVTGNFAMIQSAGTHAKELCWDWMCRIWYEDPARESVSEEWSVDYITRAVRVHKEYIDLKNEIGSGIPIISNESKVYDFYITNKNNSLSKAVTMTDILNGKGPQGEVTMPDDIKVRDFEDTSGHYPDVAKRLEADARNEQRRLEVQARGKTIAAALAATTKVHADDAPMKVPTKMHEAEPIKITPLINDTQEDEEINTMFGHQQQPQQQTVMLVNHLNQPITTMQGQTLNVPAHIYQYGGAVMQRTNSQGQPYFDNQGYPMVVLRDQNGAEQFIELVPGQTALYQQIIQQEQQQQTNGVVVGGQQNQANGLIPQTATQEQSQPTVQTNTSTGTLDPDAFPGAELLGMTIDNTPKNPKTNAAIDSLNTIGVHVPQSTSNTNFTPATETAGLIPQTETVQEEVSSELEPHRFWLNHEGEKYHAALLEDEEYISKDMHRVFVIINPKTHARAVAYIGDDAVEFIVERETFMNREKHLGYSLNTDKGECTAYDYPSVTAENTMAVIPDQIPLERTDNILVGGDRRCIVTEAAILQKEAGSTYQLQRFELNEIQPIVNIADAVWDMWGSQEHDTKFDLLVATYNEAVSNREFEFAHYLANIGSLWITDVIYNRIGIERKRDEQIEIFNDLSEYFPYLNEEGKWDDVLQELENDWDVFFNISYEDLEPVVEDEEEIEEPEVSEEVDQDVAEEKPEPEVQQKKVTMNVAVQHEIAGDLLHIPELAFDGEVVLSNGALDPTTSIELWSILKAGFDKLDWKPNAMNYLYVSNSRGELMLFGSNDKEFGYIRLIAKI